MFDKIITEKCATCTFKVEEQGVLYCWFDPPSVFPSQRQNAITKKIETGWITVSPTINPDRWCGRYKKADK